MAKKIDDDDTMNCVISVPKGCTKLKIKATFYDGYTRHKARAVMDDDAIDEARRMYLELDPDDDAFAVYMLTEKGRAILEEQKDE